LNVKELYLQVLIRQPSHYFLLLFDVDVLKRRTGNHTEWEQQQSAVCQLQRVVASSPADTKTQLGVVMNMGVHPMSSITDRLSGFSNFEQLSACIIIFSQKYPLTDKKNHLGRVYCHPRFNACFGFWRMWHSNEVLL
jgi:hypothetical protein